NPNDISHISSDTRKYIQAIQDVPNQIRKYQSRADVTRGEVAALAEKKIADLKDTGVVENVRWERTDDATDSITIKYEQADDYGVLQEKVATYPVNSDAVIDPFNTKSISPVKRALASPALKFASDKLSTVLPATRAIYNQALTRQTLGDMMKNAYAPLGNPFTPKASRERKVVDQFLEMGDDWIDPETGAMGKVFSYDEAVVRGVNG